MDRSAPGREPRKSQTGICSLPGLHVLSFLHVRQEPTRGKEGTVGVVLKVHPCASSRKHHGTRETGSFSDPAPWPAESETLGQGPGVCFNRPCRWFSGSSLRTTCLGQLRARTCSTELTAAASGLIPSKTWVRGWPPHPCRHKGSAIVLQ